MGWTATAVFSLLWLAITLPGALALLAMFWRRRALQPIKARAPL
jgi:hypothetical protein